jgi:hypothetical protein
MVKLVDTRDLKSLAARCAGSSPASGTKKVVKEIEFKAVPL